VSEITCQSRGEVGCESAATPIIALIDFILAWAVVRLFSEHSAHNHHPCLDWQDIDDGIEDYQGHQHPQFPLP